MTSIRPERLLIAGAVAASAWWYLLHGAGMPAPMSGMPEMSAAPALPVLIGMWIAMMAAMMLPSAVPWIAAQGTPFAAGYLGVWTIFGAAAALLQWILDGAGALSGTMALHGTAVAAVVVATAGIYELSPFKHACLRNCRPNDRAREAAPRAFWPTTKSGIRQGIFCLGCCWALMGLLFVAGVMNVVAMVALSAFIILEKLVPQGARVARIAGVALLVGAAVIGWRGANAAQAGVTPCSVPEFSGRVLCGSLAVRESAASGRTIRIAYLVIPAGRRNAGAVFEVGGGPGQSAIDLADAFLKDRVLVELHTDHDLVFVDQRGTGRSRPLQCAGMFASRAHAFAEIFPSAELRACRARLAKVADLNAYGTQRAADDLDAVRSALGYPAISFSTGSYGSQFAFVYLRSYPSHVRALLLEAVAPTYIKLPLPFSRGAQHALDELRASCAKDAACSHAFPGFRRDWDALAARFARGPQRVTLTDRSGATTTVSMSREVFADRVRQALYSPYYAAALPAIVHAAAHGDDAPLARLVGLQIDSFGRDLAQGMNLSIACAEDVAFITPEERAQAARTGFLGDLRIRAQQRACAIWNVRPAPASFIAPVRSAVPVLMISGGDDPATPPWLGASQLRYLPNARQIVVPGGGHNNETDCLDRVRIAFLNDPRPSAVRASCAAQEQRPPFVTNLSSWIRGIGG